MARLIDRLRPQDGERRASLSEYVQWVTSGDARFPRTGSGLLPSGLSFTMSSQPAEAIAEDFVGYVDGIYKRNGVVAAVELVRLSVFAEARFLFQRLREGRPGDLFSLPSLSILERPWEGGTTGDLLARMIVDADMAGNFYGVAIDGEIVRLRPDWVEIILEPRMVGGDQVGYRRVGYAYYEGGPQRGKRPAVFLPDEVAHFAPIPDPIATYRGMSWLTPVIREVQADGAMTRHKQKFMENAATPNVAVSLAKEITPEQFEAFVERMDAQFRGPEAAGKTLYTAGGADVTVIGADLKQLDFKVVQGAGETRIAAAAGVPPVIVGLSEGLQAATYSNYGQARRRLADGTMRPLWRNAAGSLESIVRPPPDARLWVDTRDIPFLREDSKNVAEIQQTRASAIRSLVEAGYEPDSVRDAIVNDDLTMLTHTGLFSVQLNPANHTPPDD